MHPTQKNPNLTRIEPPAASTAQISHADDRIPDCTNRDKQADGENFSSKVALAVAATREKQTQIAQIRRNNIYFGEIPYTGWTGAGAPGIR